MHRTHANVNFMYTLTDEDGEVHPPKDSERAEISISSEGRPCGGDRCSARTGSGAQER